MIRKTSELEGVALDYAVAVAIEADFEVKANYVEINHLVDRLDGSRARVWEAFKPSTDWSQGGPLIDKHKVDLAPCLSGNWKADSMAVFSSAPAVSGSTPLIAACRAVVTANLGYEVEVPEEMTSV